MSYRERLDAFKRELLAAELAAAGGNVAHGARGLGMKRPNLHRLLRRYDLHGRGPHAPNKRGG